MDIVAPLLASLLGTFAAKAGDSLYNLLQEYFRKQADKSPDEFHQLLFDLSRRSPHNIRRLIETWAADPKVRERITLAQREEIIALLINLTRGGRSTCVTLGSGVRQNRELLSILLDNIKPIRRHGEAVGSGWQEWKLDRFLGKGSFGEVWRGRNPGYPRPRAFKFFTEEKARAWLKREQQALYRLCERLHDEPNVVEFVDVVISDQKYPFLVLEYVDGGSLEDWILSCRDERVTLDKQDVMEGIIRGLAGAHAAGLHHCDLKPANVLLTSGTDPQPKVADFGLGEVEMETTGVVGSAAGQAVLVGTSMYLPPEALNPFARRQPARDDLFALGVLWYQFLVERIERPPYDYAEQLQQAGTDSHTIRLIGRCLAAPQRRFANAGELEAAIVDLPPVHPVRAGEFDVQYLAREYLSTLAR